MTRQEQYNKLQEASKMLHAARRLILEAKPGGDNVRRPFFGRMQVAYGKSDEALELLAETCHDLRQCFPTEVE